MNLYQILGLGLLLVGISATFTNTTDFWKDTLKVQEMHYQCYSGIHIITQDTKRSIGTTPKENQPCTTACSVPISTDPPCKIQKYHSSSGYKEVQDPARNLELSPRTGPSESPRIKSARPAAHGISSDIQFLLINPLVLDSLIALIQACQQ